MPQAKSKSGIWVLVCLLRVLYSLRGLTCLSCTLTGGILKRGEHLWSAVGLEWCIPISNSLNTAKSSKIHTQMLHSCQVFVNFRLWMVAESPFRKETVLAKVSESQCDPSVPSHETTSSATVQILLFSFLCLIVTFGRHDSIAASEMFARRCWKSMILSLKWTDRIACFWTKRTKKMRTQRVNCASHGRLVVLAETPLGDFMQPQISGLWYLVQIATAAELFLTVWKTSICDLQVSQNSRKTKKTIISHKKNWLSLLASFLLTILSGAFVAIFSDQQYWLPMAKSLAKEDRSCDGHQEENLWWKLILGHQGLQFNKLTN